MLGLLVDQPSWPFGWERGGLAHRSCRREVRMAVLLCQTRLRNLEFPLLGSWRGVEATWWAHW